jgi:hypothetical protein
MGVDETGRERHVGTLDDRVRVALGTVPDQRDPALEGGDVGHERRGPAAVVDAGIAKNRVQQSLALPSQGTGRVRQRASNV